MGKVLCFFVKKIYFECSRYERFFWICESHHTVGMRLPRLLLLKFDIFLANETPKWQLLQLLICVAFQFLTISFARATFVPNFFLFFTGQWETKDYESPTHNSDIIINYFVFIFQCVLMFYHFWFIRLLNTSNCFIITFSLNDFIHELTFLLKDAIWDKYLVRSKRASWEC